MDHVFFIASKLIWMLLRPDSLLMVLLLASWILLRRRPRLARGLLGAVLVVMAGLALWPAQNILLAPLESRHPRPAALPASVDGILVLGGAELTDLQDAGDTVQLNAAGERLIEAAALSRHYPTAKLVFSGGNSGLAGGPSGAVVAERLFTALGVPQDRLVLEPAARNTAENARLMRDLIQPRQGQRWLLVTSAFHMQRSVESFCAAGWTGLIPWPTDFRQQTGQIRWQITDTLFDLTIALREWIGLAAYRLTAQGETATADCLTGTDN